MYIQIYYSYIYIEIQRNFLNMNMKEYCLKWFKYYVMIKIKKRLK